MLALPNQQGHPRLGVALTKRHVRKAVERNRIRRQLRESFRQHQNSLDSFDVVILGRAGIDKVTSKELRAVLDSGWESLAKRCKKFSSC